METKNYLIIQNNVVTNVVVWDGNTDNWNPPSDATMLVQSEVPAKIWQGQELVEVMGVGSIGFTWNGSVLTTNEEQPPAPPIIPVTKA